MSKWEILLMKEVGDIVVESYKTKKQAETEIEHRNNLCRHLGYEPNLLYKIREVKNRK
jgi:hypothetical protein